MIRFSLEIKYQLSHRRKIKSWLTSIAKEENKEIGELNFLFVDDELILKYNKKYLKHDYYTDVITFDSSENNIINGDIIVSIERVIENAQKFKTEIDQELRRVMAHGLLHLLGYNDKTKNDIKTIRFKENYYLKKYQLTENQ